MVDELEKNDDLIEQNEISEEENGEKDESLEKRKLQGAIEVLSNVSLDEIKELDDECFEKFKVVLKRIFVDEVIEKINSSMNELTKMNTLLRKSLDENEEFRVTSKVTLQKNVQLLEDQVYGSQFNKFLKPIAQLYSNYAFMLETPIDEVKTKSNIEGILEELESFLEDYGVEKIEANVGDDFNPLNYKIVKKIETSDVSLDKKVAAVKQPGWKKERNVLVPLKADMYVYNNDLTDKGEE